MGRGSWRVDVKPFLGIGPVLLKDIFRRTKPLSQLGEATRQYRVHCAWEISAGENRIEWPGLPVTLSYAEDVS